MRGETQALHLAKMMKNYIHTTEYELALPLVRVRRSKLKKLSVEDVLLLELKLLEFVLIEGDTICAKLDLISKSDSYKLEIINIDKNTIITNDSNKYELLKLSFGVSNIKEIKIGNSLDIEAFDLNNVTLMLNDKKIAEGSLVTIDNQIAVKINKVKQ